MSIKLREALGKFNAVDFSGLKFPLDGDSSTIYNSNKKEITIPYWRVADLLNEVKEAQDIAKFALAAPPRNCDVGTAEEQIKRHRKWCKRDKCLPGIPCSVCFAKWAQMPYEEGGAK